ncbi:14249_t:CDS:2, partial [Cetraspora pellucida]
MTPSRIIQMYKDENIPSSRRSSTHFLNIDVTPQSKTPSRARTPCRVRTPFSNKENLHFNKENMTPSIRGILTERTIKPDSTNMYRTNSTSMYRGVSTDMYRADSSNIFGADSTNLLGADSTNIFGIDSINVLGENSTNMFGTDSTNIYGVDTNIYRDSSNVHKGSKIVNSDDPQIDYFVDNAPNKKYKNALGNGIGIDMLKQRIMDLEKELANQIEKSEKTLRDFDAVRYIAQKYKNELYGPVYIDGDQRSINKLLSHISKNCGPDVLKEFKRTCDGTQPTVSQIFEWLEDSGYLIPVILQDFRATEKVVWLDLTHTFEMMKKETSNKFISENQFKPTEKQLLNRHMLISGQLLGVFALPNSFHHLTSLKLSSIPIRNTDIVNLRGLKKLNELFIDDTGIGNEAIAHIVALKNTLRKLDLTGNKEIDDEATYNLIFFETIEIIFLDGTSVSMDGVRKYVSMTKSPRLSQITIPKECRNYLNRRNEIYCIERKHGMIEDPSRVQHLPLSHIRAQLKFHYEVNDKINITGSLEELAKTLKDILKRRKDDAKVMYLA